MDLLLIVLLATAGGLCGQAASEGENALPCGLGERFFGDSCWWADPHQSYSWAWAEAECKARNSSLASIRSQQEQVFVTGLTGGQWTWTGLTYDNRGGVGEEGESQWTDGTPLDYLNWAERFPADYDTWDCIFVEGSAGVWRNAYCDYHLGVVCRRDCGEDQTLFGGSCWWWRWGAYSGYGDYTWAEAEDECRGRGLRLASIHSQQEQDFVTGELQRSGGWSGGWTGLTDAATEGEWQWSDGTPVDYLNWGEGQGTGGDSLNCVLTSASHGEWYDVPCGIRLGVVCRRQLGCGEGQTLFGGSCWWWSYGYSYTWAQAKDECRHRGLTVASIHSQQEQDFVADLTEGQISWIGLTDAATEGEWLWSDGTPVDYLNWDTAHGQPNGEDTWDCVYTEGSTGGWWDDVCDLRLWVVCRGHPY